MASIRVLYENAIYHVYSRGNSKRDIFIDKEDFEMFLKICSNTYKKVRFDILAFCLMPNHYHLLIQTPDANLPEIMRLINQKYAIYFNRKYKDVGYVFQSRYKAKVVENSQYFNQLIAYIHLNPLKANLVQAIDEWAWSSYLIICKKQIKPNFFNRNKLEDLFGTLNLINEVNRSNVYYDRFSADQLSESLCTNLINEIEALFVHEDITPLELTQKLVKACLNENIISTKSISKVLGLSEGYVRKIKRTAYSPGL